MDIVMDSELVYTAYAAGQFGVARARDGALVWSFDRVEFAQSPEQFYWGPALDGDRIYLGGRYGAYAFKRR